MSPASIVVVDTMGGLGDLLLGLPVVHGLAASHPDARLTVVTTAPWHVLLESDPAVHEVVPVPGRTEQDVVTAVTPALLRIRPDLAVTTNRQFGLPALLERSAAHAVTNLWRSPPADELVDLRMTRLLVADGWIAPQHGALPATIVLTAAEVADGAELLAALGAGEAPALLFPDSGMRVKHWPLDDWATAVRGLRRAGSTPVVVSRVAEQRAALAAAGAVVAPDLPLRALAGLCAAAAAVRGTGLGGDTGPVRLAAASGLPVVGLFGPTAASRYGYRPQAAINLQGLPGCSIRRPTSITEQQCWWHGDCPLTADRSPACMADIRPAAVLEAAATVARRQYL